MSKNKKIWINKRYTLVILCVSFASILLNYSTRLAALNFYYKLKYFTVGTWGRPSIAARDLCKANPFFNQRYAVMINMALPSNEERLQVIDLQRMTPVLKTRVMHGRSSGNLFASQFSNRISSSKTALGRYVVVSKYFGKFGQAYRLAGLDKSNSNALARSIVLHSSKWVSGTGIGRSQGCPAVSVSALAAMKPYLHEGTLIWIHK